MSVKDALPLVPKHLAKRLVGGKDDKGSNQDFYRDFKYIYVDIPEPEEDFPCESFKQKSITTSQGLDIVSLHYRLQIYSKFKSYFCQLGSTRLELLGIFIFQFMMILDPSTYHYNCKKNKSFLFLAKR